MSRFLPFLVALALVPSWARADDTHYQTFLIGERALGMGGAATGVGSEASAVFYNPGGLAFTRDNGFSGNLSINAYDRRDIDQGYGSPLGVADLTATSRPAVPVFASGVAKFGRRDADGVRPHAFAFTTLTPVQRSLRMTADLADGGVADTLRIDEQSRTLYLGPTLSFRLPRRVGFGVSLFLVTQRFRHSEDQVVVTEGEGDPSTGVFTNNTLFVRESLLTRTTRHLVARIGVTWEPAPRWRLGVMVQPPGIEVTGEASIRERISFADLLAEPATALLLFDEQKGLGANAPIPFELRVGASFQATEDTLLALDLSVHGPRGSADDRYRTYGAPAPDPVTGNTPLPGLFVEEDAYRTTEVNLSVGFEQVIRDSVPLRVGFFTDRSAAPAIDGPTDVFQVAQVDRYGATFTLGWLAGGFELSVGAAALFGRGTGLRVNPDAGGAIPETYLPTDVRDRTVYFFVSGYKRAATVLGRQAWNAVRDRRRNAPAPEDAPPEEAPPEAAPPEAAPPEAAPPRESPASPAPTSGAGDASAASGDDE